MKKDFSRILKYIFAIFIVSLLWACNKSPAQSKTAAFSPSYTFTIIHPTLSPSGTPSPTIIPSPTNSPTVTSTPEPSLVAHEWNPSEPLITFGVYGGDGGCGLGSLPPTFTLLSDGELFFDGWNDELKAYKLQTTKLSRQGTCNLLNSIDQAGFFDYDPSTYVNDPQNWIPPVMGAGRTYISVQAWRSNSISLYDLDDFINNVDEIKTNWGCGDCPNLEFPTILPSLRKTYQLLLSYQPANLEIYQSDRLGIWIDANGETDNAVAWPLKSIKLSEIVFQTSNTSNRPDIILSGENAAIVYQLFIQNSGFCDASVTEGDKVYRLFARHLLPYEYQSNTPVPKTLSCSPADGWIEVP